MSRMETCPASISLGQESAQMWSLNKRLEAYLSRVKALEEENELLRAEIHHLKSTRSDRSLVREYHDEMMKLRDALDDEHREMVQVETDRDCIYQEIEYVKELCLQEKQAQEDVKKELSESKKLLEEEKRSQMWLKERLMHLEQEMEDILKTHEEDKVLMEEEISSYSQRLENFKIAPVNFKPVNVEDYANQLSQIWQGAVEEYKTEVSALETNLSQAKDNLQKVLDENKQSHLQLQSLERDLQSLKGRKEMLEELLAKQWLEQQDEEGRLQLEIETLEKEKEDLRAEITQVLEDRQQLMHLKMSLSLEVATYRSLLEAESTRLYTPSADYKLASSFGDSVLEQKTFRKSRHENTKPLVSRNKRLNANKKLSAETSSTNRYLNVKSASFSNRASPVTKEFQKVSSVLQSQGLNYTKASSEKAVAPLPSVESNLGRSSPNGDVFKKSKAETISHFRDYSKPVTKETMRKDADIQPDLNRNTYNMTDARLKKTDFIGDAKGESLPPTANETVNAQVESSSKFEGKRIEVISDFGLEEQQHFMEAPNKDKDTLAFEKPQEEKTDFEVPVANDDRPGEDFGNIDEEHITGKQEVVRQIVSCQRVYIEKGELVEPLEYENIETQVKVNNEEFRKVLDFSKPNTQDLDEPNVLSSDGVSGQAIEYALSQELDFDTRVSLNNVDVDNASQDKEDIIQEADEEKENFQLNKGLELSHTEETSNYVEANVDIQVEDVSVDQKFHVLSSPMEDVNRLIDDGQNFTKNIHDEEKTEKEEYNENPEKDTKETSQDTNIQEYNDNQLGQQASRQEEDILEADQCIDGKQEHTQFDQEEDKDDVSEENYEVCTTVEYSKSITTEVITQSIDKECESYEEDNVTEKEGPTPAYEEDSCIPEHEAEKEQEQGKERYQVVSVEAENRDYKDKEEDKQLFQERSDAELSIAKEEGSSLQQDTEPVVERRSEASTDMEQDNAKFYDHQNSEVDEDQPSDRETSFQHENEDLIQSDEGHEESSKAALTAEEYAVSKEVETKQSIEKDYDIMEEAQANSMLETDKNAELNEVAGSEPEEKGSFQQEVEEKKEDGQASHHQEVEERQEGYDQEVETGQEVEEGKEGYHQELVEGQEGYHQEVQESQEDYHQVEKEEKEGCHQNVQDQVGQELIFTINENVASEEDNKRNQSLQKDYDEEQYVGFSLNIIPTNLKFTSEHEEETQPEQEQSSKFSDEGIEAHGDEIHVHGEEQTKDDLILEEKEKEQEVSENKIIHQQSTYPLEHECENILLQNSKSHVVLSKNLTEKYDFDAPTQNHLTEYNEMEGAGIMENDNSKSEDSMDSQESYRQETEETQERYHQEVEVGEESHNQEEEDQLGVVVISTLDENIASEEDHRRNQPIQEDSDVEQNVGVSLKIFPNILRFTSENDAEAQPEQQEQSRKLSYKGTETREDEIHQEESENVQQNNDIILEAKEQVISENEITHQQSTFPLEHECENLFLENSKSHVVLFENLTEKYDFDAPTEKHLTEFNEMEEAGNMDNDNYKSEDSMDSQEGCHQETEEIQEGYHPKIEETQEDYHQEIAIGEEGYYQVEDQLGVAVISTVNENIASEEDQPIQKDSEVEQNVAVSLKIFPNILRFTTENDAEAQPEQQEQSSELSYKGTETCEDEIHQEESENVQQNYDSVLEEKEQELSENEIIHQQSTFPLEHECEKILLENSKSHVVLSENLTEKYDFDAPTEKHLTKFNEMEETGNTDNDNSKSENSMDSQDGCRQETEETQEGYHPKIEVGEKCHHQEEEDQLGDVVVSTLNENIASEEDQQIQKDSDVEQNVGVSLKIFPNILRFTSENDAEAQPEQQEQSRKLSYKGTETLEDEIRQEESENVQQNNDIVLEAKEPEISENEIIHQQSTFPLEHECENILLENSKSHVVLSKNPTEKYDFYAPTEKHLTEFNEMEEAGNTDNDNSKSEDYMDSQEGYHQEREEIQEGYHQEVEVEVEEEGYQQEEDQLGDVVVSTLNENIASEGDHKRNQPIQKDSDVEQNVEVSLNIFPNILRFTSENDAEVQPEQQEQSRKLSYKGTETCEDEIHQEESENVKQSNDIVLEAKEQEISENEIIHQQLTFPLEHECENLLLENSKSHIVLSENLTEKYDFDAPTEKHLTEFNEMGGAGNTDNDNSKSEDYMDSQEGYHQEREETQEGYHQEVEEEGYQQEEDQLGDVVVSTLNENIASEGDHKMNQPIQKDSNVEQNVGVSLKIFPNILRFTSENDAEAQPEQQEQSSELSYKGTETREDEIHQEESENVQQNYDIVLEAKEQEISENEIIHQQSTFPLEHECENILLENSKSHVVLSKNPTEKYDFDAPTEKHLTEFNEMEEAGNTNNDNSKSGDYMDSQEGYHQETEETQEGYHQEVEEEDYQQEEDQLGDVVVSTLNENIASEEDHKMNQPIQKDSNVEQNVEVSLKIFPNILRFTSENDAEAQPEQQEQSSELSYKGTETREDEIHQEEFENVKQNYDSVLEAKEQEISEKEIIHQQSTFPLEHECENLLLENSKSHVVLSKNPTEKYDFDAPTEKHLKEFNEMEEAGNTNNDNSKSGDYMDSQEGYHQETEETQEGYHQEVEVEEEDYQQEVEEEDYQQEWNQPIQKDSDVEQNVEVSLKIFPNILRFTSENDAEVQPEQQEQSSELSYKGTETCEDEIHQEESENVQQSNDIVLEAKEQEISENEIIHHQQSTFPLEHECENLLLENVVLGENPNEKYNLDRSTEERLTELDKTEAADNLDNDNSKSEDSMDSQDISIYSQKSEEFEISKDYQLEQTLPDTTPLPNFDDEFEELTEDEIILASKQAVEVTKLQSSANGAEAEEVLDSILESQSSQVLPEVSEQSNLIKDDHEDYNEQQDENTKDLLESELPQHFVDPRLSTEDSSGTLDAEEPAPKPSEDPVDSKMDAANSKSEGSTASQEEVAICLPKVDEFGASKDSQLEKTQFETTSQENQVQLSSEQLVSESVNEDHNDKPEERRPTLVEDTNEETVLTKTLDFVPSSEETKLVPSLSHEDTTENKDNIIKEHSDLTQDFGLDQTESVDTEDHERDFGKEDKKCDVDLTDNGEKESSTESLDEFSGDNIIGSNVPNIPDDESEVNDGITIGTTNQEDIKVDVRPLDESSGNDDSVTSDESSPNMSTISYASEQEESKTQRSKRSDIDGDTDSKSPKELEQNVPLEPVLERSLEEKVEPQTSSDEEKYLLVERSDSSFASMKEHEDTSEFMTEYREDGKTSNGIFGHAIIQATLDFDDHIFNGHSAGENSEIIISEAKMVRVDGDIVNSQSQDKIEHSVIEFTKWEGKSEGLFQSLLETSELEESLFDEASEAKNIMQAAVKYVDSASEQSSYTKKLINPYLTERDLQESSEITSSVMDEDLVNTKQEANEANQCLKMNQEHEDAWSSDE